MRWQLITWSFSGIFSASNWLSSHAVAKRSMRRISSWSSLPVVGTLQPRSSRRSSTFEFDL
jgi:hypothetical protein